MDKQTSETIKRYDLFEMFGIEIEYMIADKKTLDIRPISDRLLKEACGSYTNSFEAEDEIIWSNELALHVLEFKTKNPSYSFDGLSKRFLKSIEAADKILDKFGCRLMPGAMHPWMDSKKEFRIWPHKQKEIYNVYDKIFSCNCHGFANIQSIQINLPFADENQFVKLHNAIRILMPIIPCLSAGSPFIDCDITGLLDSRIDQYEKKCQNVPALSGLIIPEHIYSIYDYYKHILKPMYKELLQHDLGGIICRDWANSRGAIAHFWRHSIEIRIIDIQESPIFDLAIAQVIIETLKRLCQEDVNIYSQNFNTKYLYDLLKSSIKYGPDTKIAPDYAKVLGADKKKMTAKDLWKTVCSMIKLDDKNRSLIETIIDKGTLAQRMLKYFDPLNKKESLFNICSKLCACLDNGHKFI